MVIDLRGASHLYHHGEGLRSVSLTVSGGEVHALVGMNGAGKSTMMRLVLGMVPLSSGSVTVLGHSADRMPAQMWRQVGHSVDDRGGYPDLSIRENLHIEARLHRVDRRHLVPVIDAAMQEFDIARFADRRVRELSAGNRQRAGLAAALVHDPRVLVLDEPTTALDPVGVLIVRRAIQQRARAGAGVLVSSHHLDEVARVADTITVLNRGRVIGRLDPAGRDLEVAFFDLVRADEEPIA